PPRSTLFPYTTLFRSGRETPGLFPRGQGVNIWFRTTYPSGAGLHVYADPRCALQHPMRTFRVGQVNVSWSSNFGDDRASRCLRRSEEHTSELLSRSDL